MIRVWFYAQIFGGCRERLRPPNGEHFKYHNFERMYLQQKQAHRLCHTPRCSHAPTVFRLDYMSSQRNHAVSFTYLLKMDIYEI